MYNVAVIVASDSCATNKRQDGSGVAIRETVENAGYHVVSYQILPDDRQQLANAMAEICDQHQAELILTTGGTGFSPRDVTPEATLDIVERLAPGIPEAMRQLSLSITPRAMLSRAAAGLRKSTLIVNLPGSPKAVKECLEFILPAVGHGLDILTGASQNCAR